MPVKVIVAWDPEQIVWLEVTTAVGNGSTFSVILPVTGCVQDGVPEVVTLTRLYTVVAVNVVVIVAVPDAFNAMV